MPMGDSRFRSIAVREPRLAPYAASPQPAWLWSTDGSRILWCNDAGAAALGILDPRLLEKPRSPADPHARQVAQLARRLSRDGAIRLERLRGFGARFGQLATCACAWLQMRDGETAILLVAVDAAVRAAPLVMPPLMTAQETTGSSGGPLGDAMINALPQETSSPDMPTASAGGGTEVASLTGHAESEQTVRGAGATAAPLRFVWQIDSDGAFSLTSDEFLRIAGERTAQVQGRTWTDVAQTLELDAQDRIAQAIARRETFSGLTALWPLEREARERIELSGMPVFDGARDFAGYRGFGIYRHGIVAAEEADVPQPDDQIAEPASNLSAEHTTAAAEPAAPDSLSQAETDTVEPPQNVVPFPLANDTRMPSLSVVENHAFDEIARRLTQKFDDRDERPEISAPVEPDAADKSDALPEPQPTDSATAEHPAWLGAAAAQPRGASASDRMLLDLVPSGILIYRLDRLLYANGAFLARTGYDGLHALQEAGGLDALYVEPGPDSVSSASDEGMPLTVAAADRPASDARLFSILWDGDAAHALILQDAQPQTVAQSPPAPVAPPEPPSQTVAVQPPDGAFEAILHTATDGIVLFERSGAIVTANRSAEALFGIGAHEFQNLNFADLFAAESQRIVLEYFESLDAPIAASPIDHGREVLGRERGGGFIPLSMTMGRTGNHGERFFAVFRDLSQLKKNETELLNARRKAERATAAKTDALANISHEIRGPLNTIIGFANIMIEERFGILGNDRYLEYLKDIRASGERAVAILDDIVNISSAEAGNRDLKLVGQNLNEMVEQCVGVLQPQANRERVIIRTSLAHALPQVMADTQALRQITMNIVMSSIRFSKAGGQVIVSTAAGDNGGAILRVRDTGRGLSETELASATGERTATGERSDAVLRAAISSHRGSVDRGAIDLSLARALAEANRAQFQIKTTENAGTLIEVAFANVRALAG
jgi:PAS domain S-box-containing protein